MSSVSCKSIPSSTPATTKLCPVVQNTKQTVALPKDIYKIAIVDDSRAYVKRFQKVLEKAILSFEGRTLVVLTVSDPTKALQLMTKEKFSLCFLDNIYKESSLSGIEMCNRMNMVEEETKLKYSPRILMSGEPPLPMASSNLNLTTISTASKRSQSTKTLLRIEKKEVGVALLYDLLRVYGKCLTVVESNYASLPLLSNCTRNRLTTGKSGVSIMFWGPQKVKQISNESADDKDRTQKDYIRFLDLPPLPVRNIIAKRTMAKRDFTLINTSKWDIKNIHAKNRCLNKLSYKYQDQKGRTNGVIFVDKPQEIRTKQNNKRWTLNC